MTRRILKRLGKFVLACAALVFILGVAGYLYGIGFKLDELPVADPQSQPADLAYLRNAVETPRGKVLAIVTSTDTNPNTGKPTGYELTELSRAYYVFEANGYEVDIASPLGGEPPMVLDDGLVEADHAFLNDPVAMRKLEHSLPVADVEPGDYAAVYFVGGKGTLFDFPDNVDIQRIVRTIYADGGVVSAVCHGPAALLNVTLDDGSPLLKGRRMTGFTNDEELFLTKKARTVFPFLLQEKMSGMSAEFVEGELYLDNTVVDGRLVTGQNPWSTWSTAEAIITALGHVPVPRERSSEELAVDVVQRYYREGTEAARNLKLERPSLDRRLILMHALVAGMQARMGDAWNLQRLARP
ncbi:type 1 glutamine amidotransferase domain-containing protein [Dokdonella sp.]|uniref:type 1 glutamine amidotransferase domain-containing protein n=1 Tax=Dokdonella sp. TaxID=2291710 RepID=UPI003C519615